MPAHSHSLFVYDSSRLPEVMFFLDREGGNLITADSLQNWTQPDEFFTEMAVDWMAQSGFFKPANIGPEWRRFCQPDAQDFVMVAELEFQHLLPSHGTPLLYTAKQSLMTGFAELLGR
ncbi:hypothetical protein PsAD13_03288 [Pseudovibrio sp. Ad13]|uniref:hypothetical protein n=1 Tax=Pseudovibrio sp. Ad13 TaxID=989396 RepID=UPI0007B2FD7E|nr:hypothetical protein [Pseudovibrio sp. Ad13]KZK83086.1 hypothetical protein PsAD13_03288 [Pseudovibrio sp. Ad13]